MHCKLTESPTAGPRTHVEPIEQCIQ